MPPKTRFLLPPRIVVIQGNNKSKCLTTPFSPGELVHPRIRNRNSRSSSFTFPRTSPSSSPCQCISTTSTTNSFKTKSHNHHHHHLLSHYLKNQRLDEARNLFDQIPSPHVTLYTKMLLAYAKNHRLREAINLFHQIPSNSKDIISWNSIIKACLHCGDLLTARKLFDQMPHRTAVSFTTIIDGFFRFGLVHEAETLFLSMPPLDRDIPAWNAMIHGYWTNDRIDDALRLFHQMPSRDVISWTSIISGLDHSGKSEQALLLFHEMVASGVGPSSTTLVCGLSAAAKISAFHVGLQIHCFMFKLGDCCFDEFISASLVTFYSSCKRMETACKVFDETVCKNVVVWTALVTGYGLNNKHQEALKVFGDMMRVYVVPNESSFTSALNSCCGLEDLERGKVIHSAAIKMGLENAVYVGNSLVVMYSKCGYICDAIFVFEGISEKSIVPWNSIRRAGGSRSIGDEHAYEGKFNGMASFIECLQEAF